MPYGITSSRLREESLAVEKSTSLTVSAVSSTMCGHDSLHSEESGISRSSWFEDNTLSNGQVPNCTWDIWCDSTRQSTM
jgi:hypothetical protein